jgi:hypothetical protein
MRVTPDEITDMLMSYGPGVVLHAMALSARVIETTVRQTWKDPELARLWESRAKQLERFSREYYEIPQEAVA